MGLRVTVCEMPDESPAFERAWRALVDHCRGRETGLVLLPELPFYPWFGTTPTFSVETWRAAEGAHRAWIDRLQELAPAAVLATAPVTRDGRRLNEGFVWDEEAGYRTAHHKFYLPNEEGAWEAQWYERGDGSFEAVQVGVNEFLLKPVSSKALQDRMVAVLTNPRPVVQSGDYYGPVPRKLLAGVHSDTDRALTNLVLVN